MEKNKKMILLVGMILLAVITVVISIILLKSNEVENPKSKEEQTEIKTNDSKEKENKKNIEYFKDRNLLIQKVYINKSDYTTKGVFITTEGYIYEYSLDDSSVTDNTLESMIENSTKLDKVVSTEDLNTIKENINNLKDEIENIEVNENSSTTIMIQVYTYHGPILIKAEGKNPSENRTYESQELLKIINKYIN